MLALYIIGCVFFGLPFSIWLYNRIIEDNNIVPHTNDPGSYTAAFFISIFCIPIWFIALAFLLFDLFGKGLKYLHER